MKKATMKNRSKLYLESRQTTKSLGDLTLVPEQLLEHRINGLGVRFA
jgi:hypothetical protein